VSVALVAIIPCHYNSQPALPTLISSIPHPVEFVLSFELVLSRGVPSLPLALLLLSLLSFNRHYDSTVKKTIIIQRFNAFAHLYMYPLRDPVLLEAFFSGRCCCVCGAEQV